MPIPTRKDRTRVHVYQADTFSEHGYEIAFFRHMRAMATTEGAGNSTLFPFGAKAMTVVVPRSAWNRALSSTLTTEDLGRHVRIRSAHCESGIRFVVYRRFARGYLHACLSTSTTFGAYGAIISS